MEEVEDQARDRISLVSPETKKRILTKVETKTREIFEQMPLLPPHDINHVKRVVGNVRLICQGENLDPFVYEISAWLHDIGRLEESRAPIGRKVYHAEVSANHVPNILNDFIDDLGKENIREIEEAIRCHSRLNTNNDSRVAVILKDADRLDALGSIGIARSFVFYPEKPLYNPLNPFSFQETNEDFLRSSDKSTHIDALFRAMELFIMLKSKTAVQIGIPRIKLMLDFLYQMADIVGVSEEYLSEHPLVEKINEKLKEFI